MTNLRSLDRRKHQGPFRFMFMDFKAFLRRVLNLGAR